VRELLRWIELAGDQIHEQAVAPCPSGDRPALAHDADATVLHRRQPVAAERGRAFTCADSCFSLRRLRHQLVDLTPSQVVAASDEEHVNITDVGHLTSDMDEGEDKLELASRHTRSRSACQRKIPLLAQIRKRVRLGQS
jgi:hypothetical protein